MPWHTYTDKAKEGDLVQLLGSGFKSHFVILKHGKALETHRGVIKHDAIIGEPWGKKLTSHTGNPFYLLQPDLSTLIENIKRSTQIIYTKDISFILLKMGIGPGCSVLEAGTGSGGFTTALAFAVGENGHVYSYERNPEVQRLAVENLKSVGLDTQVEFILGDIIGGFGEKIVNAVFYDLINPQDYLMQAKNALKSGGYFGAIVPTTNQAQILLERLKYHQFICIEMCEIFLRYFKTNWERLRPTDRMIAHTGYLVFARSVLDVDLNDEF